jgi:hypothetical protein
MALDNPHAPPSGEVAASSASRLKFFFRFIWNLALAAYGILIAIALLPRALLQIYDLPWHLHTSFIVRCASSGISHLGLVICIWLALASFASWTWQSVSRRACWWYIAWGVVFLLSVIASIAINHWDMGFSINTRYVEFLLSYAFFAFPIVVLRIGYLGLAVRLGRRILRTPTVEEA